MAGQARAAYFLLAGGIFLLDRASKWLVAGWLARGEVHTVVPGLLDLVHTRNRGAAFGLLAGYDSAWVAAFLIVFSVLALALVLTLLWRGAATGLAGVGLALILGGAFGNLVDRLLAGSVIDFLDFHLGRYHWPAFNLADSAIVLGAGAVLAQVLRNRPRVVGEA